MRSVKITTIYKIQLKPQVLNGMILLGATLSRLRARALGYQSGACTMRTPLFVLLIAGASLAYPITVPVIYYDFKADGSNEAFENDSCNIPGGGPEKPGMVQQRIGTDRKPRLATQFPTTYPILSNCKIIDYQGTVRCDTSRYPWPSKCSRSLEQWFWPSGSTGRSAACAFSFDTTKGIWGYTGLVLEVFHRLGRIPTRRE